VAAWYFNQGSPEGIRKAIEWDPGNARYSAALAQALQNSLGGVNIQEVVDLSEQATRLSPHNASYWADMGGAYEWAGRLADAQRAYEQAQRLFPNSPDINWKLGNFYVRVGKVDEALRTFRNTLLGEPNMRWGAFDLAWRATGDSELILAEMLPPDPAIFLQYLDYLSAMQRMDEAGKAWARFLELGLRFEPQDTFRYLDALIQRRRVDELKAAWAALAERFPSRIRRHAPASNLITNGDFESEVLNGGLDWRAPVVEGVMVSVDSQVFFDGSHSLRIEFDSRHNPDYRGVFQCVPVEPNSSYRFIGYMRTRGITTDSGPRFQIYDAYDPSRLSVSTENVLGTSAWSPHPLEFKIGPETRLLIVCVARPASHKFDNQIAGMVWIDGIGLTPVE